MISKPKLRFEFVGMLFALAIGQVAFQFANLFNADLSFSNSYFSVSHLLLATFVISMSWIGWQSSKSFGNIITIDSIFGLPYLVLLIDILLVIFYFLLASGSEQYNNKLKTFDEPSVINETFLTLLIFSTYLIWDIITKVIKISYKKENDKYIKLHVFGISELIKRGTITFVCTLVALYFYLIYSEKNVLGIQVLIVDINLILLFLAFRGWKHKYISNYKLNKSQIPDSVINFSTTKYGSVDFDSNDNIIIYDKNLKLNIKKFLIRFFPFILIILLELYSHICL